MKTLLLLLCSLPLTIAVRKLRIASPLQALTLWDHKDEKPSTPRQRFLPRFRAGLEAEAAVRKTSEGTTATTDGSSNWAQNAAARGARLWRQTEAKAEAAFDQAFEATTTTTLPSSKSDNAYQFVGVVDNQKVVTWYARPKPVDSQWSVRLVHANKAAIVKDLFQRGQVDVFAKYRNEGIDEATKKLVVKGEYSVQERSWK